MQKTRFYTVLIIPGAAARVRRVQFPVVWVKRAAVGGVIAALLMIALVVDYVNLRREAFELESLRALAASQKRQLVAFSNKIGDLEAQMEAIKTLDHKLRQITGLEKAQDPDRTVAVGGGSSLEEEPRSRLEQGREALVEKMRLDLETLSAEAREEKTSLEELEAHLEAQRIRLASTPSIWPVRGWLTSGFGKRISPFTEALQMHEGIDIAGPIGATILAPAAGVVVKAGKNGGYGNFIAIEHGYGIETRYGHLHKIEVKVGQRVKRHQPIAKLGNTGRSTGPHLHYEVRVNGVPVNPARYILN